MTPHVIFDGEPARGGRGTSPVDSATAAMMVGVDIQA
jgi:hypothetical protein